MLKKYVIIFFLFSCFFAKSQFFENDSLIHKLQFSILTCSAGVDIYTVWGHTALRIYDSLSQNDYVYNFGTFDFDDPNFVMNFVKGNLNYFLSINQFKDFKYAYQVEKRGVDETILYLNFEQKKMIIKDLQQFAINPYYRYNFTDNNCTNKISDIFIKNKIIKPIIPSNFKPHDTYRRWIVELAKDQGLYFTALGINIMLGLRTDKILTGEKFSFLPILFKEQLETEEQHKNINIQTNIIVEDKITDHTLKINYAYLLILLIFVLFWVAILKKRKKLLNILRYTILITYGLIGILICYMWFFSNHTACHYNYNILWANPLFLGIVIFKNKLKKKLKLIGKFMMVSSIISMVFLMIFQFLELSIDVLGLQFILLSVGMTFTQHKRFKF